MTSPTNSRRTAVSTVSIALVAAHLATIGAAFAMETTALTEEQALPSRVRMDATMKEKMERKMMQEKKDAPGKFCARITDIIAKTEQEIEGLSGKADMRHADQAEKIEANREHRDAAKQNGRIGRDVALLAHIAKLKERAGTDAKKQEAVAMYEQTVTAALKVKQTAVDAAVAAYRAIADKAVADRQAALRTAVSGLTTAVKAAEDKAKTDCAATGALDGTIRTAFMQGIKTARQKLTTDRKTAERVRGALATAATARQQALQKAEQEFRSAIEAARRAIRAAFGETPKDEAMPAVTSPTNQ